eukprot:ANDGO_05843.mRNA.1 Protein KBP homolog
MSESEPTASRQSPGDGGEGREEVVVPSTLCALLGKIEELEALGNQPAAAETPFAQKYESRRLLETLLQSSVVQSNAQFRALVSIKVGENMIDCEETGTGEAVLSDGLRFYAGALNLDILASPSPPPSEAARAGTGKSDIDTDTDSVIDTVIDTNTNTNTHGESASISGGELDVVLDGLNTMGILWNNRSELDKAEAYLRCALRVKQNAQSAFYLAQVLSYRGQKDEAAHFIRMTMKSQLSLPKYDVCEWADNAVYLSGYYLQRNAFAECEHCLNAAEKVILNARAASEGQSNEGFKVNDVTQANLHLARGKFWLWRMKMEALRKDEPQIFEEEMRVAWHVHKEWILDDFSAELGIPKPSLDIPAISSFEDARVVFRKALYGFTKAQEFYVLDGYVTDYTSIAQDISLLYKALLSFEADPERVVAMHKRRCAALEPIVSQLNPQHYTSLLRQLWFELGEIYSSIAEVKPAIATINKSLDMYTKFVESFTPKDGRYAQDSEEAVMISKFHLARVYGKVPSPEYLSKSRDMFSWVVEYEDRFKTGLLPAEVDISRQMASLLPMKIASLLTSQQRAR